MHTQKAMSGTASSVLTQSDSEADYQPDPHVRLKAMQVIRKVRDNGLRDYAEQKTAYLKNRYPTPPSDVARIPMPRFARRTSAGADGDKAVGPTKTRVGMKPQMKHVSAEDARENEEYERDVHFHQRRLNDRAMAAKPKNILQRHIASTEGKVLQHKCGGAVERRAPAPPSVEQVRKTPEEIIVVAPSTPQYNGTYTLVRGADGEPRWENGSRRLYKADQRWRIDDAAYTWIEAARPHDGKPAHDCVKWDVWHAEEAKWVYDPTIIVTPAPADVRGRTTSKEPGSLYVQAPEVDEYQGYYHVVQNTQLDGQKCYRKDNRALISYEGFWIIYNTEYVYVETSCTDDEPYPGTVAWDRWDGEGRRWVPCTVNLIYPSQEDDCIHSEVTTATGCRTELGRTVATAPGTAGTMGESLNSSSKPTAAPSAASATFLTQLGRQAEEVQSVRFRRDSETEDTVSLVEHLPPLQLPNFTCEDIVTGRALSNKREIHEIPLSHDATDTDEPDSEERQDHKRQQAKKIESILFGLQRGNVKLSEAQRVFGLTYRFNEVSSSLSPMPNHFARFAECYGTEKAEFYLRCTREIRRVATQRPLLYKKKCRILGDILKNQPEMKAANPRWRHASRTLHRKIFYDVEKDFRIKRDGLLRIWFEKCMEALPDMQPPACRAVCVYLEHLIQDPELMLCKDNFVKMCDSVLLSRHYLLKDVLRLLWCVKWLFQVTDEQFVEIVRGRTRTLFEFQMTLPALPPVMSTKHPVACMCTTCLGQAFRNTQPTPSECSSSVEGSPRGQPLAAPGLSTSISMNAKFTPKPPAEPPERGGRPALVLPAINRRASAMSSQTQSPK